MQRIFKILNILPLISQYIYSLSYSSWLIIKIKFGGILRYIISIPETILISINHCHICLFIKKVSFILGIKIYNSLPPEIKDLSHNIKKFKFSLSGFLRQHSLYTLQKYCISKALLWYILTTKLIFIILSRVWNFEVCFHVYILNYIKDDNIALYCFDCK